MPENGFRIYLLTMAAVTYLIRMIPLVLIKKKIENRFLLSFLYYIPYTVLTAMTIPAIFHATQSVVSAFCGFAAAVALAYFKTSLTGVAAGACAAVFVAELLMRLI